MESENENKIDFKKIYFQQNELLNYFADDYVFKIKEHQKEEFRSGRLVKLYSMNYIVELILNDKLIFKNVTLLYSKQAEIYNYLKRSMINGGAI